MNKLLPTLTTHQTISMLREWQDLLRRINVDEKAQGMFDMGVWGVSSKEVFNEPVCAMAACAGGFATTIPSFAARGLELRIPSDYNNRYAEIFCGEYQGNFAIATVLSISFQQAWRITNNEGFDGEAYRTTPLNVVDRIQRVIDDIEEGE